MTDNLTIFAPVWSLELLENIDKKLVIQDVGRFAVLRAMGETPTGEVFIAENPQFPELLRLGVVSSCTVEDRLAEWNTSGLMGSFKKVESVTSQDPYECFRRIFENFYAESRFCGRYSNWLYAGPLVNKTITRFRDMKNDGEKLLPPAPSCRSDNSYQWTSVRQPCRTINTDRPED